MPPKTARVIRGFDTEFPGAEIHGDTWEFVAAVEAYQRKHQRRFPSWSEVLSVLTSLGYRKVPSDAAADTQVAVNPPCACHRERR